MRLSELELDLPAPRGPGSPLEHLISSLEFRLPRDAVPVRLAVSRTEGERSHCEVGILTGLDTSWRPVPDSIFRFARRKVENPDRFSVVFLVPTGVGAEIGGHAGDATPAARLLGATSDRLITHPNVVNAADLNEMPENTLYVEGSVIARLLMGTAGLAPVRSNRILTIVDDHEDPIFPNSAINAVNAARASGGIACDQIANLKPRMEMITSYASSGRAAGHIEGFANLCALLDAYEGSYDAVAITTVVDVDRDLHDDYFQRCGDIVNPWGGVEAMLTHTISALYGLPSAHSPMYEDQDIMNEDPGIMDPRVSAEGISVAFLHCVLKGLARSPRIVADAEAMARPGVVTAEDVSCLVIPDGCLGLPTLAALEQGIPVIAVRENRNKMANRLEDLPWQRGQFHPVENYWEAAGVLTALKAGVDPASVRRPLPVAEMDRRRPTEIGAAAAASEPRKIERG